MNVGVSLFMQNYGDWDRFLFAQEAPPAVKALPVPPLPAAQAS